MNESTVLSFLCVYVLQRIGAKQAFLSSPEVATLVKKNTTLLKLKYRGAGWVRPLV